MKRKAIIIGAGPAGLTAAYELLTRTDIKPIVYEMSGEIGGISKTVSYKGNRIDIGGHRFFSKSDRVMAWWRAMLPLQGKPARDDIALSRKIPLSSEPGAPDPERDDRVMLFRRRMSRIFFLRRFINYPLTIDLQTMRTLGLGRILAFGASYARARLFPIRNERSLEDFFSNRFGRNLYGTFFRGYTEKVWGVPCDGIKPDWGAQRVKGLSIGRAVLHAAKSAFRAGGGIEQKDTETSLIKNFWYPKLGPGQLWEEAARRIVEMGGEIHLRHRVVGVSVRGGEVAGVDVEDASAGRTLRKEADFFLSTMPVSELVEALGDAAPADVRSVAKGLRYRDFITIGLLCGKLRLTNDTGVRTVNGIIPDNWLYIQETDVNVGRVQIFNNWSPYLVRDPSTVWLGLEYFCSEGDDLWRRSDEALVRLGIEELEKLGFIDPADVRDATVIRMKKTYPAYFGTYDRFGVIRDFTDRIPNLFLIGRNGMHRYNNADHSMLTAIAAVDAILGGAASKEAIWSVNAEADYHEGT